MGVLSRNARILREIDVTVLIEGHTDERGTVEYNLALGERRAIAVKDYLVSLGVPARRLQVTSYGESRPFAMGSNENAWAQNRRAHFARP
jgi:peptidoglycan-associated lipoprotein